MLVINRFSVLERVPDQVPVTRLRRFAQSQRVTVGGLSDVREVRGGLVRELRVVDDEPISALRCNER